MAFVAVLVILTIVGGVVAAVSGDDIVSRIMLPAALGIAAIAQIFYAVHFWGVWDDWSDSKKMLNCIAVVAIPLVAGMFGVIIAAGAVVGYLILGIILSGVLTTIAKSL